MEHVSEVLQAVGRASKRSSSAVHEELRAGVYSLATIACLAPWVGLFGTILGIANSFHGGSFSRSSLLAIIFENLSYSFWPTAFGLLVGLVSLWFYRYLIGRLLTFDLEMETASVELVNHLRGFRGPFTVAPVLDRPSDGRMFGEVSLDELRRDEKFRRRCMYLAGTSLVIAWFVLASPYFLFDSLPLYPAARSASICLAIIFGLSSVPARALWVKFLHRRAGGMIALASVFCLCWSVAELLLGVSLP